MAWLSVSEYEEKGDAGEMGCMCMQCSCVAVRCRLSLSTNGTRGHTHSRHHGCEGCEKASSAMMIFYEESKDVRADRTLSSP